MGSDPVGIEVRLDTLTEIEEAIKYIIEPKVSYKDDIDVMRKLRDEERLFCLEMLLSKVRRITHPNAPAPPVVDDRLL